MTDRIFSEAGSTDRLDGGGAGCHDSRSVRVARRRGGIFLDSPFHRTTPSATNRNGSIVFDVADSPPLRGGECAAPKTLSKKLKVAALLHKGTKRKNLCLFESFLCLLWSVPGFLCKGT